MSDEDGVNTKTIKIALGRRIESDAIRFLVVDSDNTPTINAILRLAKRVQLGGSPQHLAIRNHSLKSVDGDILTVVTLHDTVPGGTGHLRALMPAGIEKADASLGGLAAMRSMFAKTLALIEACACGNACYKCLLSYDNQYHHNKINRWSAIKWLQAFAEADDWKVSASQLIGKEQSDGFEESVLEQRYKDSLEKYLIKMIGVSSGDYGYIEGSWCGTWTLPDVEHSPVQILHTQSEKVNLPKAYTKPDFTLRDRNGVAGYIYIDGKVVHLNPALDNPHFVNDVYLRTQLDEQLKTRVNGLSRVLTFSEDMMKQWVAWMDRIGGQSKQLGAYQDLSSINFGPKKMHVLCAVMMKLFGSPAMANAVVSAVPQGEHILNRVKAAYTAAGLLQIMSCGEIGLFWDQKKDGGELIEICQSLEVAKVFGGLSLQSGGAKFKFVMNTAKSARSDANGNLSIAYKESWELFWILWSVLPVGIVVLDRKIR